MGTQNNRPVQSKKEQEIMRYVNGFFQHEMDVESFAAALLRIKNRYLYCFLETEDLENQRVLKSDVLDDISTIDMFVDKLAPLELNLLHS